MLLQLFSASFFSQPQSLLKTSFAWFTICLDEWQQQSPTFPPWRPGLAQRKGRWERQVHTCVYNSVGVSSAHVRPRVNGGHWLCSCDAPLAQADGAWAETSAHPHSSNLRLRQWGFVHVLAYHSHGPVLNRSRPLGRNLRTGEPWCKGRKQAKKIFFQLRSWRKIWLKKFSWLEQPGP